jgi:hypothetical protein
VNAPLTVRELLPLLQRWRPRLLSGDRGLDRTVSWANTMRARLPAFGGLQGGEFALLSLATLRALRAHLSALSLSQVVDQLTETGVSGIAVAGLADPTTLTVEDAQALEKARARADEHGVPLIGLPTGTPLAEVEAEVISQVAARRDRQPGARETWPSVPAQFRASLRDEALDALLSGTYVGEAQMRLRAAQLGHDLSQPYAALWVELRPHAAGGLAAAQEPTADALRLAEEVSLGLGAWARARGSHIVALVPLAKAERGVAELAEGVLGRALGARSKEADEWSAGLGEAGIGPAQIRRSATEAHDAARLGLLVLGSRHVARPEQLGVYRLLLALREHGELEPFVEHTLAPLAAEVRTGDALLETLEMFFACNGNLSEAARKLHLHRNSLIYRLERVNELLGRSLDDSEVRLALQLALKGRRVLGLQ